MLYQLLSRHTDSDNRCTQLFIKVMNFSYSRQVNYLSEYIRRNILQLHYLEITRSLYQISSLLVDL